MTVVLERFKDSAGLEASIEQDKYQTSFTLCVYEPDGTGFARSLFRNTYTTMEGARRAMRRQLTAPVTRTFKFFALGR